MKQDEFTEEQREYMGTIPNEKHATLEAYLKELRGQPDLGFNQPQKSRAYDL